MCVCVCVFVWVDGRLTSSASFASSRTAVSASSVLFPWEPQSSDRPAIFSLTITPISMKDIFFLTGALTVQCRSCCSVHGELLSPLLCSTLDCYNQLSSHLVSKCNSGPKCFKASKAIMVINVRVSSWHGQRGAMPPKCPVCPTNAKYPPLSRNFKRHYFTLSLWIEPFIKM